MKKVKTTAVQTPMKAMKDIDYLSVSISMSFR